MNLLKKIVLTQSVLLGFGLSASTAWAADANDEAGKLLFTKTAQPACAVCHTLAAAGATGEIGPSLNDLKPDEERVMKALKNGIGQMPAFTSLSEEQMQTLAKYVAKASKQ